MGICTKMESNDEKKNEWKGGETEVVRERREGTIKGGKGEKIQGKKQFVVSGDPSVNITSTTNYPFEVKTNGSACSPEAVLNGIIQVKPIEILTLSSDPPTENQNICEGTGNNTLDPIIYTFGQGPNQDVIYFTPNLPGVVIT